MSIAAIFAAVGAFLVAVAALRLLWQPTLDFIHHYQIAEQFHDPFQSAVIAGGGGRKTAQSGDGGWETGLTNEPHDQLNLTPEAYERGLTVAGILVGVFFFLIMWMMMPIWGALFFGVFGAIAGRFAVHFTIVDNLKKMHVEQLRKFPFFLDIFLLTVQAGGDLSDAITMYRGIYGNDAIGRELAILQESYGTYGDAESFDRLRNRVGEIDLKNVIGELAQKIRVGDNLQKTLENQSEDMRQIREELGAKAAERLNAQFSFPVIFAAVATLLIFLSPAIALIFDSGFL